jgi:hypothetical protein
VWNPRLESGDRYETPSVCLSLRVHGSERDTLFNISHLVAQRRPLSGAQQRNKNKEDGVCVRVAINERDAAMITIRSPKEQFLHTKRPHHTLAQHKERLNHQQLLLN